VIGQIPARCRSATGLGPVCDLDSVMEFGFKRCRNIYRPIVFQITSKQELSLRLVMTWFLVILPWTVLPVKSTTRRPVCDVRCPSIQVSTALATSFRVLPQFCTDTLMFPVNVSMDHHAGTLEIFGYQFNIFCIDNRSILPSHYYKYFSSLRVQL